MRRLLLPDRAVQDVLELAAYIRRSSPQNAQAFLDRFHETQEKLRADTLGFRRAFPDDPSLAGVFRCHVRGHPNHVVLFEADDRFVRIRRVLHGSRDDLRERAGDEDG